MLIRNGIIVFMHPSTINSMKKTLCLQGVIDEYCEEDDAGNTPGGC